ncbi:sensor histidine kinase [Flavisolibacter ginsenosidimutans]|uniref:histidine kinase n=1 Tax=Flavisolibacter ginsenosidimutans TaxID=661481 RepID=A0A5B8UDI3_9BACT|nr:response regulator [Flavisolibacter ginsenosidimutans]QEC54737.1 response regulator [Flavisolibacter ginsenosidimutans]
MNPDDLTIQSPIKILVVDDREDNLFSIETILERDNYRIVKAQSGKAALKILLNQHDFTLILMDVQMPDMNGFETANLIYQREKLKHIPIIFITAHNYNDEHVFEGYKVGAIDYIYKPINPELLRFKVGVFAEMYQKNHQLLLHERKLKQANASLEKEVEERKLSEEKVRLLNQQLLENNNNLKATIEELDRFAYVASHDLQEPLRKILVFSDKLLNDQTEKMPEEMVRYLEKIVKASERMQKLINDLLIFSKPADNYDGFVEVDLNNLLAEVVSDMEVEIEKCDAQVKVNTLPKVWAIPSQMRQLFQNLISNGIKFRKPNGIPVVSIYNEVEQGSLLEQFDLSHHRIVVEDNGIGFDDKYADEIFVVFKRLHSYHEYEGTGVGLSICKKIIDRHGGKITARSKPGEGSRFQIELPAQRHLQRSIDRTVKAVS